MTDTTSDARAAAPGEPDEPTINLPQTDSSLIVAASPRISEDIGTLIDEYARAVSQYGHADPFVARRALDERIAALTQENEALRTAAHQIGTVGLDDAAPCPEMGDSAAAEFWRLRAYAMATWANVALATATPTEETGEP